MNTLRRRSPRPCAGPAERHPRQSQRRRQAFRRTRRIRPDGELRRQARAEAGRRLAHLEPTRSGRGGAGLGWGGVGTLPRVAEAQVRARHRSSPCSACRRRPSPIDRARLRRIAPGRAPATPWQLERHLREAARTRREPRPGTRRPVCGRSYTPLHPQVEGAAQPIAARSARADE
jgi:hypothetical protein